MRLSDFTAHLTVVDDAEFNCLGYVDSDRPGVLVYADNLRYLAIAAANPNVGCIITTSGLADHGGPTSGVAIAESPRDAFYSIHRDLIDGSGVGLPFRPGRGSGCRIHPSAVVADGCLIGDNVIIGEQVVIRDPVWIGSDVVIEPGVKLGVEGILYSRSGDRQTLIPHAGYVRIRDGASLMSNAIVVRSVHDCQATDVGCNTIIGLASIVGHEAGVGDNVVVSNQCTLARRSIIGCGSFIGTNVFVKEHVVIGAGARVMAGSVVVTDVPENSTVSGNFAEDHTGKMRRFLTRAKREKK